MDDSGATKIGKSIRMGAGIWDRVDRLAAQADCAPSEVTRVAILRGLQLLEQEHYSADNSRLVNRKLQQRQGRAQSALAVLQNPESSASERMEAIAVLADVLTD